MTLQQTLRNAGSSLTLPRRVVFEALRQHETQTVPELIRRCSMVDRASVYRCIQLFEELDIIHRLQIGWKYKLELTDAFTQHHHHLTCTACGSSAVLAEDMVLEQRLKKLAHRQGFMTTDHQLEVRGLCAACQALSRAIDTHKAFGVL